MQQGGGLEVIPRLVPGLAFMPALAAGMRVFGGRAYPRRKRNQ